MKASIIIPCYNQAAYIAQAIKSALSQTYPDFEVIVVNDGSTDDSYSIIKRYNVKVVNQTNKGLAGARNAGVLNSVGDVILPLDADDWIDKEYLAKTIPAMEKNVGIVSTWMQFFGIDVSLIKVTPATLEREMTGNCLPVCSLIRREAFLETGGYNPRMAVGYEDWNLWVEILKRGWKHVVVPEGLFHYCRKQESMISVAGKHHVELWGDIKKLNHDIF